MTLGRHRFGFQQNLAADGAFDSGSCAVGGAGCLYRRNLHLGVASCRDCFAGCHGFTADGTNLVASVAVFGAGGCLGVLKFTTMSGRSYFILPLLCTAIATINVVACIVTGRRNGLDKLEVVFVLTIGLRLGNFFILMGQRKALVVGICCFQLQIVCYYIYHSVIRYIDFERNDLAGFYCDAINSCRRKLFTIRRILAQMNRNIGQIRKAPVGNICSNLRQFFHLHRCHILHRNIHGRQCVACRIIAAVYIIFCCNRCSNLSRDEITGKLIGNCIHFLLTGLERFRYALSFQFLTTGCQRDGGILYCRRASILHRRIHNKRTIRIQRQHIIIKVCHLQIAFFFNLIQHNSCALNAVLAHKAFPCDNLNGSILQHIAAQCRNIPVRVKQCHRLAPCAAVIDTCINGSREIIIHIRIENCCSCSIADRVNAIRIRSKGNLIASIR